MSNVTSGSGYDNYGKGQAWEDFLDPDEKLLWEDAPIARVELTPGHIFLALFGLPFLGAGVFIIGTGFRALLGADVDIGDFGNGFFLMLFGLPFFAIGVGCCFAPWMWIPIMRRRTRYALSNKRAFVATNFMQRKIEIYEIEPRAKLELEIGKTQAVYFHKTLSYDSDDGKQTTQVGFEGLEDGHEVYRLLRRLQLDAQGQKATPE